MHLSSSSLSWILWVCWEEIFFRSVYHSISIDEANWSTMDSLMNHITICLSLAICQRFTALGMIRNNNYFKCIPDLTFRNLSGFEEKLDPNLKLFFKFFVRLSILISLCSTLQPSTLNSFILIYGVYNWPLL